MPAITVKENLINLCDPQTLVGQVKSAVMATATYYRDTHKVSEAQLGELACAMHAHVLSLDALVAAHKHLKEVLEDIEESNK